MSNFKCNKPNAVSGPFKLKRASPGCLKEACHKWPKGKRPFPAMFVMTGLEFLHSIKWFLQIALILKKWFSSCSCLMDTIKGRATKVFFRLGACLIGTIFISVQELQIILSIFRSIKKSKYVSEGSWLWPKFKKVSCIFPVVVVVLYMYIYFFF